MRNDSYLQPKDDKKNDYKTRQQLMQRSWKLESIYETGLVPDIAKYDGEVEIVFGPMHIYALYGSRTDRFPYRFLSSKVFEVDVNGIPFRCRISRLTDAELAFHADAPEHHFIVEMHR